MKTATKQEIQDSVIKEALKNDDCLIHLKIECKFQTAEDYLHYMREKYNAVFKKEEEQIVLILPFEEYYGKNLDVLIVKGHIYKGLDMYLTSTLRGVKPIGYGVPPALLSCYLLEEAMFDERLKPYRFIVTMHKWEEDSLGNKCLLCIEKNRNNRHNLGIYYDEPIPGNYANEKDAYAFSKPIDLN